MFEVGLGHYLTLGAIIFTIGLVGIFLNRKNVIVLLMSIELILLAVNINLVSFSIFINDLGGQIFTLFILTVAAAEAAIGLAIIVVYFRNAGTIRVEEIEKLEGEYETKVDEKVSEVKEEIVDKVDAYLNYVVEEWMKENELAIEKGLRNEITEDFIGGLKSLFESHYINVPQEKYDVIESQAAEIEKLKEDINKSI